MKLQGEQKYIAVSYDEMIHPQEEVDAMQVVANVIEKAGLKVK